MLVLSRKTGEEIVIGRDINIVVRRISGNRVAIGIDAPEGVRILRGELEPFAREFEPTPDEEAESADPMVTASVASSASGMAAPAVR